MAILRVPVSAGDHIVGGYRAPVTLVEYGDYQCPLCAKAFFAVEAVRHYFGNQLRFVFRHFPLRDIHPMAALAAEAAEFADALGCFWEMHALLYTRSARLDISMLLARSATRSRRSPSIS